MLLPKISAEQQAIVSAIKRTNITVDAVAGSGKTTTILYIAKTYKVPTLLLTYNAKLKFETRERAQNLGLNNLEVHSYHSFAVKYLSDTCYDDLGLVRFFANNNIYENLQSAFQLVILDETQDMTSLYYKLSCIPIASAKRLCILGDKRQSIYGFKGADARFLTLAQALHKRLFTNFTLSVSYRLTRQMANFVNFVIKGNIQAIKDGPPVLYIYHDPWDMNAVVNKLKHIFAKYVPQDIFILSASVHTRVGKRSPLTALVNILCMWQIPIYIPSGDDRKLDERVLCGKLVFSTFHQAKGLERKCFIVLGFDSSYFHYYHKNVSLHCPNELYVAITRATEQLIVLQSAKRESFSFVNTTDLQNYAHIIKLVKPAPEPLPPMRDRVIQVTELIRYLSGELIVELLDELEIIEITPASEPLPIDTRTAQIFGDSVIIEEVSDLTACAITSYLEYKLTKQMTIYSALGDEICTPVQTCDLLAQANKYWVHMNNSVHRQWQISDYSWLSMEMLVKATRTLYSALGRNCKYEVEYKRDNIIGRVDAISPSCLWEIKCTTQIISEHILQLAIYAYLTYNTPKCYKIVNALTGQVLEIREKPDGFNRIVKKLLHNKTQPTSTLPTDEVFIAAHSEL